MKRIISLVLVLSFGLAGMTAISLPGLVFATESPVTEAFTFVQLCDPQLGIPGYDYAYCVESFKQAVRRINALEPDLVVFCGDYIHTFGDPSLWNDERIADFKQIKDGLTAPSYCAPGNHDVDNWPTVASLNRYREVIGEDYYSFEHKGYTFVIANTMLGPDSPEVEMDTHDSWFKQTLELAREKNSPIFVVQHHPLYYETPDQPCFPAWKAKELLGLFEECGVVAVITGHSHRMIINEHEGIQLVTGETTSHNFDRRPPGFRLWHVDSPTSIRHEFIPLTPGIDFNSDGIVDAADICILAESWGMDEPLYDIAPTPFGDGVVDVQDLTVLAEHLFKEILPIGCVAHWKLDQTEGNNAHNSAGYNHGICRGEPLWQPGGGKVGGALQFDGSDDYVETDFVLNPADSDGAFSVFAWIKGGSPGQVIMSQTNGDGTGQTWLGADTSDGKLMTGLRPPGGSSPTPPMVSDFVITDGQWHHIGIVVAANWAPKFRYLYLDGVRVATDTQFVELPSSNGGLHIGADKTLDAGTFFSGLIDDVRIYDQPLSPDEVEAMTH